MSTVLYDPIKTQKGMDTDCNGKAVYLGSFHALIQGFAKGGKRKILGKEAACAKMGISQSTIDFIIHEKTWSEVP